MQGVIDIHDYYLKKRQEEGFKRAQDAGIVGRPKRTEEIEKAIRLYKTKAFSIAEIEKLAGISSSTLYRYLEQKDKQIGL